MEDVLVLLLDPILYTDRVDFVWDTTRGWFVLRRLCCLYMLSYVVMIMVVYLLQ